MLLINIDILGTVAFIIAQNIDVFDGKIGEVTPFLGYFRISGQLGISERYHVFSHNLMFRNSARFRQCSRGAKVMGAVWCLAIQRQYRTVHIFPYIIYVQIYGKFQELWEQIHATSHSSYRTSLKLAHQITA